MNKSKCRGGKSDKNKKKDRRSEKRKRQKKEKFIEKVEKSHSTMFFPVYCDFGGLKSRLAQAAGAEQSDQMRDQKLQAAPARSRFGGQTMLKMPHAGSILGS